MRLVDRATIKPMRCAALPQIGSTHDRGFIDTGSEMPGLGDQWDNHIYVSVVAVEEMSRLIGGGTPGDLAERDARIAELEARVTDLEGELERAEAILDSIDALESADFRARRKTGRPKTKTEVAA